MKRCTLCQSPMKRCTLCRRQKPESDFPVTTCRGKTMIRARCRECCNSYYAKKHLEDVQKLAPNTERLRLLAARRKSKAKKQRLELIKERHRLRKEAK